MEKTGEGERQRVVRNEEEGGRTKPEAEDEKHTRI